MPGFAPGIPLILIGQIMRKPKKAPRVSQLVQLRREMDTKFDELSRRLSSIAVVAEENIRRMEGLEAPGFAGVDATLQRKLREMENEIVVTQRELRNVEGRSRQYFQQLQQQMISVVRPKRILKGGWVNLYGIDSDGTYALNHSKGCQGPFTTKEGADACAHGSRLACVQFPDFTQGEGLDEDA